MNDELNGLDYVSSSPDLVQRVTPHPKDKEDLSTLGKVFELIENRRNFYQAIDSLSLEDKTFTVAEQVAINRRVLICLQEVETMIASAVNKVREEQDGRADQF